MTAPLLPKDMPVFGTAALAAAGGKRVSVIRGLEPAWPGATAMGPSLTVRGTSGDNLALHQAVYEAERGEVIVVSVGGEQDIAHCGDLLALAARERGVAGIIIDGSIRDRAAVSRLGFPIFHCGTSPRGPTKSVGGELRVPIELMGVVVRPSDIVCADDDGLVVVPAAEADSIIAQASVIETREHHYATRIVEGASTLELFGLPRRSP